MIFTLYERLTRIIGDFQISLFYECQTLRKLSEKLGFNHLKVEGEDKRQVRSFLNDVKIEYDNTSLHSLQKTNEKIAIINVVGRYPKSNNIDELWENLLSGRDCVTPIPEERWRVALNKSLTSGKTIQEPLSGGFLTDVDKFDAELFGISARDATYMDPQERFFLEIAWECFETAGYTREKIIEFQKEGKKIGVFVGATYNNYQLILNSALNNESLCPVNSQTFSIANKVSYFFDLKGPSLVIDTACSSSLYALHLASQSIESGECDLALVGGVNLSLHPSKYYMLATYGFLSSDGKCRAFGDGGDGYVPSEGVGAILIKRGQDAIKDCDIVLGWLAGTGVSHGGHTNGFTVPNPEAQANAIQNAFQKAQWQPNTVSYVEAHGTGTALGDPIEVAGLVRVFKPENEGKQFCALGSIKSNIGHSEAAAGMAQITKLLLQFKYKMIVPTLLHSSVPNRFIDFEKIPFYLPLNLTPWKRLMISGEEIPRRAGISSFGAGGVNVHVLLEEPPLNQPSSDTNENQENRIYVFSAGNKELLTEHVMKVVAYIKKFKDYSSILSPLNVTYTLQCGREVLRNRLGIVASGFEDLFQKIEFWLNIGENVEKDIFYGKSFYQSDQEDMDFINYHFKNKNLKKIAKLWTMGFTIPWQAFCFNQQQQPIIVFLPARPFLKKRYWPCARFLPDNKSNMNDFVEKQNSGMRNEYNIPVNANLKNTEEATVEVDLSEEGVILYVQSVVSQLLGYNSEDIDNTRGFFELGMDSLKNLEMIKIISERLNINIPETTVFNYQTPEKLSLFLYGLLKQQSSLNRSKNDNINLESVALPDKCEGIAIDNEYVEGLLSLLREVVGSFS